MEEMDKIFGGNQGEEDLRKIREIRQRLGMNEDTSRSSIEPSGDTGKVGATTIEYSGKEEL